MSCIFEQQIHENTLKQKQYLRKINDIIEEIHEKLLRQSENRENQTINNYKQELYESKLQFNKLHEERNDEAVRELANNLKKSEEKKCLVSINKSLEVSKKYQSLKNKWSSMILSEREMALEYEYIKKQIQKAQTAKQYLQRELSELTTKKRQRQETMQSQLLDQQFTITCNKITNQNKDSKQNYQKAKENTQKYQANIESRLRFRTEQTRDYISSFSYNASTLEGIFLDEVHAAKLPKYKHKLALIQHLFSKPQVKTKLYYLLFDAEKSSNTKQ